MPAVDELIPPAETLPGYARKKRGVTEADVRSAFKESGARFLQTAAQRGLEPHHRVLDLGCGVGRFAVALAGYLDERGSYVGVDISAEAIDLCQRWIGSKLPRFSFRHADVFNTHYNPAADERAARYRFPFEDGSFDFAFSNSLFTHLLPDDAENYILEIGRVLGRGGRTLNTIYLLNDESLALLDGEGSKQGSTHEFGQVARVKKLERPEAWIAYEEAFIRDVHERAGLTIEAPIRYGNWPGREASGPGFGGKDIVVAVKQA